MMPFTPPDPKLGGGNSGVNNLNINNNKGVVDSFSKLFIQLLFFICRGDPEQISKVKIQTLQLIIYKADVEKDLDATQFLIELLNRGNAADISERAMAKFILKTIYFGIALKEKNKDPSLTPEERNIAEEIKYIENPDHYKSYLERISIPAVAILGTLFAGTYIYMDPARRAEMVKTFGELSSNIHSYTGVAIAEALGSKQAATAAGLLLAAPVGFGINYHRDTTKTKEKFQKEYEQKDMELEKTKRKIEEAASLFEEKKSTFFQPKIENLDIIAKEADKTIEQIDDGTYVLDNGDLLDNLNIRHQNIENDIEQLNSVLNDPERLAIMNDKISQDNEFINQQNVIIESVDRLVSDEKQRYNVRLTKLHKDVIAAITTGDIEMENSLKKSFTDLSSEHQRLFGELIYDTDMKEYFPTFLAANFPSRLKVYRNAIIGKKKISEKHEKIQNEYINENNQINKNIEKKKQELAKIDLEIKKAKNAIDNDIAALRKKEERKKIDAENQLEQVKKQMQLETHSIHEKEEEQIRKEKEMERLLKKHEEELEKQKDENLAKMFRDIQIAKASLPKIPELPSAETATKFLSSAFQQSSPQQLQQYQPRITPTAVPNFKPTAPTAYQPAAYPPVLGSMNRPINNQLSTITQPNPKQYAPLSMIAQPSNANKQIYNYNAQFQSQSQSQSKKKDNANSSSIYGGNIIY